MGHDKNETKPARSRPRAARWRLMTLVIAVAALIAAGCSSSTETAGEAGNDDDGADTTVEVATEGDDGTGDDGAGDAGNDDGKDDAEGAGEPENQDIEIKAVMAATDDGRKPVFAYAGGDGSFGRLASGITRDDTDPGAATEGTFGSVALEAGFTPDPYVWEIVSGGSEEAATFADPACAGFIASQPDYVVEWAGSSAQLRMLFLAELESDDTTLAVLGPDGTWTCGDDTDGALDPSITITDPAPGAYAVWVGSYQPQEYYFGHLYVTQLDLAIGDLDRGTMSYEGGSMSEGSFGSVALDAGFEPDVFQLAMVSGGPDEASAVAGPDCVGFVATYPDFIVDWSGETDELTMLFLADDIGFDTTLVVLGPDGTWTCGDDADEGVLDPTITIDDPAAGEYAIWVGSYLPDEYISGVFYLSEDSLDVDDVVRGSGARGPGNDLGPFDGGAFGSVELEAGFTPDPYEVSVRAGGDNVAYDYAAPHCAGSIATEPDFVVDWSGNSDWLRVFFVAEALGGDGTLAVLGPDGIWTCGDDSVGGLDPMITIEDPEPGQYAIWAGSYFPDERVPGTLYLTETLITPLDYAPVGAPTDGQPFDPTGPFTDGAFGSVALEAGFQPDPVVVDIVSGGVNDVFASLGEGCVGYVATEPDYVVDWSGTAEWLRFLAAGEDEAADMTLVISAPDGSWYCGDDSADTFDPSVTVESPAAGTYAIWVGSYRQDEFHPGVLAITGLDLTPADLG